MKRKSKNHCHIHELLKSTFPSIKIINEYKIKIRNKTLYIDMFIPLFKTAIEINGSQHYQYNDFMHKDKSDLIKQQFNDELKKEYCEINNIKLIILKDTDVLIKEELINLLKGEVK